MGLTVRPMRPATGVRAGSMVMAVVHGENDFEEVAHARMYAHSHTRKPESYA